MEPKIDESFAPRASASRPRPMHSWQALPDLYEKPRRRMHPMIAAGLGFIAVSAAFYGAERYLPADWKPSSFIGGYEAEISEAQNRGKLAAQAEYDKKLKLLETAAVTLQEACKAEFQRTNDLYRAAWERANAGFKLYGEQRNQNAAMRNQIAANTTQADQQVSTLATLVGYGAALFDAPEFAQKSFDVADAARDHALDVVEAAMARGITVSAADWNFGLPDPSALQPLARCDLPAALVSSQPSSEG